MQRSLTLFFLTLCCLIPFLAAAQTPTDCDGGTVSLADGSTEVTLCLSDAEADIITLTNTAPDGGDSLFYCYFLTDENNVVLRVIENPVLDLSNAMAGVCRIYGVAFNGNMLTGVGVDLDNGFPISNGDCFDLSDNYIELTRFKPDGGVISTNDPTTICAGDGMSDAINVTIDSATGSNFAWLITDTLGNILGLPGGLPLDLEGAGPGVCLIWYLAWDGPLTGLNVGANVAFLDGCFDLSNSIAVTRFVGDDCDLICVANGGMISTDDPTTICAGDGIPDSIDVSVSMAMGDTMIWLITDTSGTVLSLPAGPPFDLDGAGAGICLIWYLSYAPDDFSGITVGSSADSLMGCFDLSNPITVTRLAADGGTISTDDPTTICAGDGEPDPISVSLTGAEGDNQQWLVTDSAGVVLALPDSNVFDLEGAGSGVCLIWNLSYSGTISGLELGGSADSLMGCFDLSNPIVVNRLTADGGTISTNDPTTICAGDGEPDPISVTLTGAEGDNQQWLVTDTAGVILGLPDSSVIDLEGAGSGVCLIWNLSYSGTISGLSIGASADSLLGCFDLSNAIAVIRMSADGGTISTDDPTMICAGDSIPDLIAVSVSGAEGDVTQLLVTDTLGNILSLPDSATVDLEGAGPGVCLIWNLSYSGSISGLTVGGTVDSIMGCFALSNSISVTRMTGDDCAGMCAVMAGTISTDDPTTICAGDTIPDPIDVTLSGVMGDTSAWLITDTLGNILGLPDAPPFDLNGAGGGVCLIWNIVFQDSLSGLEVGANANNLEGCFALSNSIAVSRNQPDGGILSTMDSLSICLSDSLSHMIDVSVDSAVGESFAWLITDTLGNILSLPDAPPFDFSNAGLGVCLIWNLAYYGDIDGLAVDSSAANLSGCFALSDPLTVVRAEGDDCDDLIENDPDSQLIEMRMSPNPANDRMQVMVGGRSMFTATSYLEIRDMNGLVHQRIPHPTAASGMNYFNVHTADLPAGIYILIFYNGDRYKSKRFVKQ